MRNAIIVILFAWVLGAWSFAQQPLDEPNSRGWFMGQTAPVGRGAPLVHDGLLTDPAWDRAYRLEGFVQNEIVRLASQQTVVLLLRGDDALHIGLICRTSDPEPQGQKLARNDGGMFQRDRVELFIQPPTMTSSRYFQIAVSAAGDIYDARVEKLEGRIDWDTTWNGVSRFEARPEAHGWSAELSIPWEELGGPPADHERWGFNVGRGPSPLRELSCWTFTGGGFHQPQRFGQIVFIPAELQVTKWGGLNREPSSLRIRATQPAHMQVRFVTGAGHAVGSAIQVDVSEKQERLIEYHVPEAASLVELLVNDSATGDLIARSVYPVQDINLPGLFESTGQAISISQLSPEEKANALTQIGHLADANASVRRLNSDLLLNGGFALPLDQAELRNGRYISHGWVLDSTGDSPPTDQLVVAIDGGHAVRMRSDWGRIYTRPTDGLQADLVYRVSYRWRTRSNPESSPVRIRIYNPDLPGFIESFRESLPDPDVGDGWQAGYADFTFDTAVSRPILYMNSTPKSMGEEVNLADVVMRAVPIDRLPFGRPSRNLMAEIEEELKAVKLNARLHQSAEGLPFALGWTHSLDRIPEEGVFAGAVGTAVELVAAANEAEDFQIVVLPLKDSADAVTLTATPLTREDSGESISADAISFHEIAYVDHINGESYGDVLVPITGPLPAIDRPVFWGSVKVPKTAMAGLYTGLVHVSTCSGLTNALPLRVEVLPIALPDETVFGTYLFVPSVWGGKDTWLGNWRDDPATVRLVNSYISHRVSPGSAPFNFRVGWASSGVGARAWREDPDRVLALWAEFAQVLLDGGLRVLGTPPADYLLQREGSEAEWRSLYHEGRLDEFDNSFLRDYLGRWNDFVAERGWSDYFYFRHHDEVTDPEWLHAFAREVRPYTPDIPLLATGMTRGPTPVERLRQFAGAFELWDINVYYWDMRPETLAFIEERRAAGDRFIFYLNRYAQIDFPLTRPRTLFWMTRKWGAEGVGLWNTMMYRGGEWIFQTGPKRWTSKAPGMNTAGVYFYPDEQWGFVESVRWQTVRDGIEDMLFFQVLDDVMKEVEQQRPDDPLAAEWLKKAARVKKDAVAFIDTPHIYDASRENFSAGRRTIAQVYAEGRTLLSTTDAP